MTTPSTEPSTEPAGGIAERYGRRRRPGRGLVLTLITVVAVLSLGFIYWATVIERDRVTWQANSFDVRSASETVVTFDVQFHRGTTRAVCTVHALNSLNTEVGLQDVEVDGGGSDRIQMKVTIPTSEEATTGVVTGCVAE